jgi:hypothetical protein
MQYNALINPSFFKTKLHSLGYKAEHEPMNRQDRTGNTQLYIIFAFRVEVGIHKCIRHIHGPFPRIWYESNNYKVKLHCSNAILIVVYNSNPSVKLREKIYNQLLIFFFDF